MKVPTPKPPPEPAIRVTKQYTVKIHDTEHDLTESELIKLHTEITDKLYPVKNNTDGHYNFTNGVQ